jgi:hypothetical protein
MLRANYEKFLAQIERMEADEQKAIDLRSVSATSSKRWTGTAARHRR